MLAFGDACLFAQLLFESEMVSHNVPHVRLNDSVGHPRSSSTEKLVTVNIRGCGREMLKRHDNVTYNK